MKKGTMELKLKGKLRAISVKIKAQNGSRKLNDS